MNTEKPGQQSNQDPNQTDREQQKKDQTGEGTYGQHDQQKDRKPGQGQQDDANDREKKSA